MSCSHATGLRIQVIGWPQPLSRKMHGSWNDKYGRIWGVGNLALSHRLLPIADAFFYHRLGNFSCISPSLTEQKDPLRVYLNIW